MILSQHSVHIAALQHPEIHTMHSPVVDALAVVRSSLVVWLQGVYERMVNFAETLWQETTLA